MAVSFLMYGPANWTPNKRAYVYIYMYRPTNIPQEPYIHSPKTIVKACFVELQFPIHVPFLLSASHYSPHL